MKMLSIVSDKKASLRKKSVEIRFPLEKYIVDLAHKMREHLINSQNLSFLEKHPKVRTGVGLAAPQIGKNIRMFAIYFEIDENEKYDFVLVNPKIVKRSSTPSYLSGGEGCLSVDTDHPGYVVRSSAISISAFDVISNKQISLNLEGYPSIVFQHEYDHLDGILFYDRINKENHFNELEGAVVID